MQRAEGSGEVSNKARACNSEVGSVAEDNTPEKDIEMKPTQTSESEPSMDNVEESAKLVHKTSEASLEDETSFINEESEVKAVMNNEVHERKDSGSLQQQTRRPRSRTHILKLLSRGSLFAIGLAVLVVGGVSSNFQPYVDPEEYENCTIAGSAMDIRT